MLTHRGFAAFRLLTGLGLLLALAALLRTGPGDRQAAGPAPEPNQAGCHFDTQGDRLRSLD